MPVQTMSRLVVWIALLFSTACANTAAIRGTNRSVVAIRLAGDAVLSGNLVVYWLRPNEVRRDANSPSGYWLSGFAAIHGLLERAVTFPKTQLGAGKTQHAYLDAPPDALVFALFDVHARTFDALLDDPQQGDAVAHGTPMQRRLDLVLDRVGPRPPKTERCSGDRDRLEMIEAPEVAGTIGNTTARRICVHLPRGYDENPSRRYPVVYVLPGFSGVDSGGSIGMVFAAGDELADDRAAIFVGVNIQTKAGASYLVDSPLTGNWDRFLTTTVPDFVDGKYRTLAQGEARGLIGQSTGGFGVVSLVLRHSDRFGVVAASAPDGLDLASWMLEPDGKTLIPFLRNLLRLEAAVGPPGQMASYAADWTPDASKPFGLRWPANPKTGVIDPTIFARWQAQSPSALLRDAMILANTRARLMNKIYLTAGMADEFDLLRPTERFAAQLTAAGITNTFVTDDGDHGGKPARKRAMVEFVATQLARDVPAPRR